MFAREIDKEAQTEGSDKRIERLSALEKKLQEQVTEIDREGFDSIGSELSAKLNRGLKRNISFYSGTSIEFTIGKDSSVGTIKWLKKSQNSLFDREFATALSQLSLNRRSPNQAELPITIRLTLSANGCDLVACAPANGKPRYLIFLKPRCSPPTQTKSAESEIDDVLGWELE